MEPLYNEVELNKHQLLFLPGEIGEGGKGAKSVMWGLPPCMSFLASFIRSPSSLLSLFHFILSSPVPSVVTSQCTCTMGEYRCLTLPSRGWHGGGGGGGRAWKRVFCILFSLVGAVIGGPSRPSSEAAPFTWGLCLHAHERGFACTRTNTHMQTGSRQRTVV